MSLDGSPEAARAAGTAIWLAEALGATLHILHAVAQPLPKQDALAQLHVPEMRRARLVLHQQPDNAEAAVLKAIAKFDIDLVVMSARGQSASAGLRLSQRLGSVAQAVIEHTPVPILLLPVRYRESLPWKSILAAVSGETAADRALQVATRLAASLGIKVTAVHVGDGLAEDRTQPFGRYTDAAHHEYPYRIEEMVERGLASRTTEECECVGQVVFRQGDPAAELQDQVDSHAASVLALGCHGALIAGRALVFKRLVESADCALLLVKQTEQPTARLRVGKALDDST
ncbi:hypothetical protein AYR66_18485 [Noviherbaspirillum denitrificans]|uniref:UspA domain-containing protein n=1 Tax=Noviherbaspirillum denitrificans TaxID=1968433 RepID=A0A254TN85_9BURK|nr:hypothetical protein AYR66_18485 [Noviherbaspirillum denitrificans]